MPECVDECDWWWIYTTLGVLLEQKGALNGCWEWYGGGQRPSVLEGIKVIVSRNIIVPSCFIHFYLDIITFTGIFMFSILCA